MVCVFGITLENFPNNLFLDQLMPMAIGKSIETMESFELSNSEVFTFWEYFHLKYKHRVQSENYLSRFVLSARISRKKPRLLLFFCCKNRRENFLIANNLCKNKNREHEWNEKKIQNEIVQISIEKESEREREKESYATTQKLAHAKCFVYKNKMSLVDS